MGELSIRLLGPTAVVYGGQEIPLGAPRERAVLAMLALRAGSVVSADSLIEQLWADPPGGAATTVRGYIAGIRKAISSGTGLDGSSVVITKKPGYQLDIPPAQVDVIDFGLLVDTGRAALGRGDYVGAQKALSDGLALWKGSALADFTMDEFSQEPIRTLENRRLDALEDKFEADMALGELEPIEELRGLVEEHPFRERMIGHLMLALYRVGRQTEALRIYGEARKRFVEELGLDLSPRLSSLEEAILLHDPTLDVAAIHPTRRSNLPVPLTSLVGREDLTSSVQDGVAMSRLVTLTGPGGVGKTRLALEVGGLTQSDYADGVAFIELADLSDGALVPEAITSSLGLAEAPHSNPIDVAIAYLSGRSMLLIVDNCEHVIEAVARTLGPIIEASPDVRVLATSRHSLGLTGERLVTVEPLAVPPEDASLAQLLDYPAVRLLVDRVDLVRPGFEVADAAAVIELVSILDGLPLAIELAAAQFRALSSRQVLERFKERLDIEGDNPLAPGRHRSVHAAVLWSYELADPPEQHLMNHIWVFKGGFDMEAAAQLAAVDGDLPGILGGLVASSLVQAEFATGPPRYWLLQTISQVVGEMASPELARSLKDRHLTFFLDRAVSMLERVGEAGPKEAAFLEPDEGNLRAAMAWSMEGGDRAAGLALGLALVPYWDRRAKMIEGRSWLQQLAADTTAPPQLRAEAYVEACAFAALTVPDGGLEDGQKALALFEGLSDQAGAASAHRALAGLLVAVGRDEEARSHVAAASQLDDQSPNGMMRTRFLESVLHRQAGQYREFARSMRSLLEDLRENASPWDEAWVNHQLADAERRDGNHDLADHHAMRALDAFRVMGDVRGESAALEMRSAVALSRGDLPSAVEFLADGLRLIARRGHHLASIHLLDHAAQVALDANDFELAAVLLGATEARLSGSGGAFHPEEVIERQRTCDAVFAALGSDRASGLMDRGATMSLVDAASRALSLVVAD